VAISFIGGGNRSTRRIPPTCFKFTDKLYHIILNRVYFAWTGFELTTLVVIHDRKKLQCELIIKYNINIMSFIGYINSDVIKLPIIFIFRKCRLLDTLFPPFLGDLSICAEPWCIQTLRCSCCFLRSIIFGEGDTGGGYWSTLVTDLFYDCILAFNLF